MSATKEDLTPTILGQLTAHRQMLAALLGAERYNILQITVGNFDRRESVLLDSPGQGARRLIVPRYGQGQNGLAIPSATVTEVCEQDEGRFGGLIVNTGANPVRLYLCPPGDIGGPGSALSGQATQRPATYLAPLGSFDFRLGNILYGGTVCAAGVGGASTLDWCTF